MNTAKDIKEFREAWAHHINQLGRLRYPFMSANDNETDQELSDIIERLKAITEKAGHLEFETQNLIKLRRDKVSWNAHFSGPHAKRIARLFRSTVIPTGFTVHADSKIVLTEIKKRNPGVRVELA